ncbi:MAG: hypothetical protein AAFP04_01825 [Myxococcota bacterium]
MNISKSVLALLLLAPAGQLTTSYGTGAGSAGDRNSTFGHEAGTGLSVGSDNTLVGAQAGWNTTSGSSNTFIGASSGLVNTTGNDNTFVGSSSGSNNASGGSGTFVGVASGEANATGDHGTFLGAYSGRSNTSGYSNTFVGSLSGLQNTTGWNNTFLGVSAGLANRDAGQNTFLGTSAGYSNISGGGNVFLGHEAGFYEQGSNKLYVANQRSGPPLIYGDFVSGGVGINTTQLSDGSSDYALSVEGKIRATDAIVTYSGWADYVFDNDYTLRPLTDVADFIEENRHLPDVPTAEEIAKRGNNLGETDAVLLRKIEELTLYMIAQNETQQRQAEAIASQRARISELEARLAR